MKEHTTHFDDCGCKTKRLEDKIAALEEMLMVAEDAIKRAQNINSGAINGIFRGFYTEAAIDSRAAQAVLLNAINSIAELRKKMEGV